jgi:hypothetical protein
MPRVETYQADQVQTQVVKGPRAGNAPAASFGAPIAQGLSTLANVLGQEQNRLDEAAAEEAVVKFERQKNDMFFNPDNGYFNTQGRDAFDQAGSMNKSLEELKQLQSDTLKSPRAKQAFDRVANQHITRSQQDIARHSSKHLKAWEVATINSQVENTLENASLYWSDSERLGVQKALGRQSILDAAALEGSSPEVTQERLQTYDSSFARSAVSAAVQSSASEGKESLDKWEKSLEGPDLLKMNTAIERKEKAEKTALDSKTAVLKAGNLVESLGDQGNARSLIMEEVNDIEDPELRTRVMKESMFQLGIKQQADSESRAATFEDGENFIIEGGSVEMFKTQNSEAWEALTPKQKRTLNSGKTVTTDYVFLSETLTLPKEKLAEVNPPDHFDKLSQSDRSKLISAVKSARSGGVDNQVGRSRTTQTSATVEELFGKKATWNDKEKKQVNTFYGIVDDEVKFIEEQKGSPLTSTEYTNLLAGMTKKVVKEGFFNVGFAFGLGNSESDLTDIPSEDLRVISDYLRKNKIPSTADNIMKAYEQASQ